MEDYLATLEAMSISLRQAVPADGAALWQVHTQSIRSARTHYSVEEIEAWAGFLTVEGYEPGILANYSR